MDADRCSVVVGRSGRAPASGAVATSTTAVGASTRPRAVESITLCNLDVEVAGADDSGANVSGANVSGANASGANAGVAVWRLWIDGGVGTPSSARRCTIGGSTGVKSFGGAGDDGAVSWTADANGWAVDAVG
jgi:uncharacterized protein YjbI with pentapeptide repeats